MPKSLLPEKSLQTQALMEERRKMQSNKNKECHEHGDKQEDIQIYRRDNRQYKSEQQGDRLLGKIKKLFNLCLHQGELITR